MDIALKLIALAIFLCIACLSDPVHTQAATPDLPINATTVCFNDTASELYLDCSPSGVVRVLWHRFGFLEYTVTGICAPPAEDECGFHSTQTETLILNECMGKSSCSVSIDPVFLNECGIDSDYITIHYQCIPDNTVDQYGLVDACGDILTGNIVSRAVGSIHTPNYPSQYPPDVACTCDLNTLNEDGRIYLTLYDLELSSSSEEMCENDWLEYGFLGNDWGHGHKMCHIPLGERTDIGSSSVHLNFYSNSLEEARGFWLVYEGEGVKNEPVEVRMECRQIQPVVEKQAVLCLHHQNISEIYLDCTDTGVIEVEAAVEGYTPMPDNAICDYVTDENCQVGATNRDDMLRLCMGADACAVGIDMMPISFCDIDSNYVQVDYKCIPNKHDPSTIMDICGDSMTTGNIRRRRGYIESLNYPADYPPDVSCYCHLTTDPDAIIRLRLIDVSIEGSDHAGHCGNDWLELRRPHQGWATGNPLCDTSSGNWIHTEHNEIVVDFHSDDEGESRGFWFEYSAMNSDNVEVPVNVVCQQYQPTAPRTYANDPDITQTAQPHHSPHIGLIIGLIVIVILMILVVAALVVIRYKRNMDSKLHGDRPPMVFPTATLQRDPQKKYASLAPGNHTVDQLYRTLQPDNRTSVYGRHSDSHRDCRSNSVADLGTVAGGNLPTSYINAAYDGYIEAHPNPAI